MGSENEVFQARIGLTGFREDIQTMNRELAQVGQTSATAGSTRNFQDLTKFNQNMQQQAQQAQQANIALIASLGQLTAAELAQLQALGLLTPAMQAQIAALQSASTATQQLAGTQSMTATQMQLASGIAQQMANYMATAATATTAVANVATIAAPAITGVTFAAGGAAAGIAAAGGAAAGAIPPITGVGATATAAAGSTGGGGLAGMGSSATISAKQLLEAIGAYRLAKFALEELGATINKFSDYLKESVVLASRVETLGVAVQVVGQNMGYTSTQVNEFEKSIINMNITTQAARQGMLYMGEALIDFSEGSKLARIAQDAAVIGNINSSQAFERLVNAIQRGEPRMLRSIGISLSFERAYVREAAALGKTERQLTDYEKSQIRVNEVIRVGARLAGTYEAAYDTVGKKLTSLPRILEQIQLAVGNVFLKGFQVGFTAFFDELEKLQKRLEDTANAPALKDLQEAIGILAKEGVEGIKELVDSFGRLIGLDMSNFSKSIEGITKQILILSMIPDIYADWKKEQEAVRQAMPEMPSLLSMGKGLLTGGPAGMAQSILDPAIKDLSRRITGEAKSFDDLKNVLKQYTFGPGGPGQAALVGLGIGQGTILQQLTDTGAVGEVEDFWTRLQNKIKDMGPLSMEEWFAQAEGKTVFQRRMDQNLDLMNKQSIENKRLNATMIADEANHNDNLESIAAEYKQKFIDIDTDQADEMIRIDLNASRKREDIWQKYNEDVAKIDVSYNQKIIDAQTKLNDDLAKAQTDYQQKQEDVQTDYQRKIVDLATQNTQERMDAERQLTQDLLDMELDLSRKIEDIWRDFGRKVAELQLKNTQAVTDQGTSYQRDLEAINRKQNDDAANEAIAHANKMADIERDYQRKILQIKLDYQYDSEELIRQRDAIGFLARQRQLQRDLAAAQLSRSQGQQDESAAVQNTQAQRQKQYDIDRRELAIHNQEKLDDIALDLQRELDAAAEARDEDLADARESYDEDRTDRLAKYEQDLEDLQIKYEQERAEANLARERDLADAAKAYARAQADARANFDRTLKELQVAKARELAAAKLAREQDLADAAKARQRDIDDANVKYGIKRRDLIAARQKELDSENQAWAAKRAADAKAIADSIKQYYDYYKALLDMRRHYNDDIAGIHVVTPPTPVWGDAGAGRRSIGQSGQVTASLTNSMYSPPAMPSRGGNWGGSRRLDIGIDITGNVDAVTQSQLVRTVKEVVHNALAA